MGEGEEFALLNGEGRGGGGGVRGKKERNNENFLKLWVLSRRFYM